MPEPENTVAVVEVPVMAVPEYHRAEVPELPGCLTEADTLDELRDNLREAISLYLEDEDLRHG